MNGAWASRPNPLTSAAVIEVPADHLTPRQAEKLLGLPNGFLRRAAERGEGPAHFKFSQRVVRYARAELLRWRDAQLITNAGAG